MIKITEIMSKIDTLDKKQIMAVLLFFLVFVVLDVGFLMQMQLGGIRSSSAAAAKLEKQVAGLKQEVARMQQSEKEKPDTLQKERTLVTSEQIPMLYQTIYSLANKNRVNITQIKQIKEQAKDARAKDPKAAKPEQSPAFLFAVDISAEYHQLGAFINDIENAPQVMAVEELKVVQDTAEYAKQKVILQLKVYAGK